jgi:polyhydroxyalkanoate synthase
MRFVLSTNGHIAALVNPPGNPKSSYRVTDDNSAPAEDWTDTARTEKGSWWPDHAAWLAERSGPDKPAPENSAAPGSASGRTRRAATCGTSDGRHATGEGPT